MKLTAVGGLLPSTAGHRGAIHSAQIHESFHIVADGRPVCEAGVHDAVVVVVLCCRGAHLGEAALEYS